MTRVCDKKTKEIVELKKMIASKLNPTDLAEAVKLNSIVQETF